MPPKQERTVLPGTVELLILRMLADGPLHGFALSRRLLERSGGAIDVQDAALYQALHRLARNGVIAGEWGVSDNKRRARFYRLTGKGARRLAAEERQFRDYVAGVFRVLGPATEGDSGS